MPLQNTNQCKRVGMRKGGIAAIINHAWLRAFSFNHRGAAHKFRPHFFHIRSYSNPLFLFCLLLGYMRGFFTCTAYDAWCCFYSLGSLVILPVATVFPSVRSVNRPKKARVSYVSREVDWQSSIITTARIPTLAKRAPFTICPF
jgi:hypothetical protein